MLECQSLSVCRGAEPLVSDVDLGFGRGEVTAIVGAPGAGKTMLLRSLNRMTDMDPALRTVGRVLLDGKDTRARDMDVLDLRARVALVAAQPTAFRLSLFDNVAYGPRLRGMAGDQAALELRVRESLFATGLFDDVRDRLDGGCGWLSTEQLHRLCLARALALEPEVLLLEDPCRGLDPAASARIEDLVHGLAPRCSVVVAVQSMQMAGRMAHRIAFMQAGRLVEVNAADELLTHPRHRQTEAYVTGRIA